MLSSSRFSLGSSSYFSSFLLLSSPSSFILAFFTLPLATAIVATAPVPSRSPWRCSPPWSPPRPYSSVPPTVVTISRPLLQTKRGTQTQISCKVGGGEEKGTDEGAVGWRRSPRCTWSPSRWRCRRCRRTCCYHTRWRR